jgi:raffinose/stachyose/melibiose transport system permease protein
VLIFVPVVLATATTAPVFRQMYAPDGAVNGVLHAVGLGDLAQPWLSNGTSALIIVMSVQIWQSTGIVFVLYYAAIGQIDSEVLEAARLDGAGNPRIIGSIIWPGVRGTTIAIAIYRVSVSFSQVGYGAAISVVLLVLAVGTAIVIRVSSAEREKTDV